MAFRLDFYLSMTVQKFGIRKLAFGSTQSSLFLGFYKRA